jgi:hypothetical protein
MSTVLKDAKDALGALRVQYPWRFDAMPTDPARFPQTLVLGALRSKDGKNVIQPHPESASMIVSFPETMDFIRQSPALIDGLIKEVERLQGELEVYTSASTATAPKNRKIEAHGIVEEA